jgi:hypothetical protein
VFARILGLPAHPLLVHAAVVLVPLLALGGIAYAVVPFLRGYLRWPVGLLAPVAPAAIVSALLSGEEFRKSKNLAAPVIQAKIGKHADLGIMAMWLAIGLGVVVLVLVLLVGPGGRGRPKRSTGDETPLRQRRGAGGSLILQVVLGVLTVGLGGVTLFYVYKTGDAGAHIVWDGF